MVGLCQVFRQQLSFDVGEYHKCLQSSSKETDLVAPVPDLEAQTVSSLEK